MSSPTALLNPEVQSAEIHTTISTFPLRTFAMVPDAPGAEALVWTVAYQAALEGRSLGESIPWNPSLLASSAGLSLAQLKRQANQAEKDGLLIFERSGSRRKTVRCDLSHGFVKVPLCLPAMVEDLLEATSDTPEVKAGPVLAALREVCRWVGDKHEDQLRADNIAARLQISERHAYRVLSTLRSSGLVAATVMPGTDTWYRPRFVSLAMPLGAADSLTADEARDRFEMSDEDARRTAEAVRSHWLTAPPKPRDISEGSCEGSCEGSFSSGVPISYRVQTINTPLPPKPERPPKRCGKQWAGGLVDELRKDDFGARWVRFFDCFSDNLRSAHRGYRGCLEAGLSDAEIAERLIDKPPPDLALIDFPGRFLCARFTAMVEHATEDVGSAAVSRPAVFDELAEARLHLRKLQTWSHCDDGVDPFELAAARANVATLEAALAVGEPT